ncbi:MAG: hypothetical protein RLO81_09220 [Fulvivirga sp.]|uniref:hypothetical protein n=1 Tax=Fulvivirga sp. TaxID=1931237 RepID=UPI0032EC391D
MNIRRYKFSDVFNVENGRITPRIPVQIGGITMGPGVSFSSGVSFSGVDLSKHVNHDIAGYAENGVFIIKGFYS